MASENSKALPASDALAFAQTVLTREPRNADALYVAGLAATELGMPGQALGFLQQAVAVSPDDEVIRQALLKVTPRP